MAATWQTKVTLTEQERTGSAVAVAVEATRTDGLDVRIYRLDRVALTTAAGKTSVADGIAEVILSLAAADLAKAAEQAKIASQLEGELKTALEAKQALKAGDNG